MEASHIYRSVFQMRKVRLSCPGSHSWRASRVLNAMTVSSVKLGDQRSIDKCGEKQHPTEMPRGRNRAARRTETESSRCGHENQSHMYSVLATCYRVRHFPFNPPIGSLRQVLLSFHFASEKSEALSACHLLKVGPAPEPLLPHSLGLQSSSAAHLLQRNYFWTRAFGHG